MACRIRELVIDTADPERLALSRSAGPGHVERAREPGGSIEIGPPGGFGGPLPTLALGPTTDPRSTTPRLDLDMSAIDRDEGAELDRLPVPGARPADVGQGAVRPVGHRVLPAGGPDPTGVPLPPSRENQ